jgi:hypothetical protein
MAACKVLGIAPKVVNLDPLQDAERVSRALNLLRTHYTPGQLAFYAESRATATKGDGRRRAAKTYLSVDRPPRTVLEAAAEVGIGTDAVNLARRLLKEAAPEVVQAVKRGSLTLNAAKEISARVPLPEQAEAVVRVTEASKGLKRQSTSRVVFGEDSRRHRSNPKKPDEQFARSLTMVDEGVRVCLTNAPYVIDNIHRAAWIKTLTETRTSITHILKALES